MVTQALFAPYLKNLKILTRSNSDTFQFWHFPILTLSDYDTFQFWLFPILTLSDSDTFQFWHFPISSKMGKNGFWHFPILTLSSPPKFAWIVVITFYEKKTKFKMFRGMAMWNYVYIHVFLEFSAKTCSPFPQCFLMSFRAKKSVGWEWTATNREIPVAPRAISRRQIESRFEFQLLLSIYTFNKTSYSG